MMEDEAKNVSFLLCIIYLYVVFRLSLTLFSKSKKIDLIIISFTYSASDKKLTDPFGENFNAR